MTLTAGPDAPHLLLAHGAGAGMDSAFMQAISDQLVARGVGVTRFEFPYMVKRRETGSRRPPDRQDVLLDCWRDQYDKAKQLYPSDQLFIGGKSMGGRMASMVADQLSVAGLVCLGYPFHPQKKPERLRIEHLTSLSTPSLILQGERDVLGAKAEVLGYPLSASIELHWFADGDHDLKPRVKSGFKQEQHIAAAAQAIKDFIARQITRAQ